MLLRSAVRSKPVVRGYLTRCRHCRIFFITHPRNAGRKDLRCPFGCREAHRRHSSTRRSVEYYRGDYGRFKKRIQNEKRCSSQPKAQGDFLEPLGPSEASETQWNRQILEHVRMVVSLIEERIVSAEEIVEMLARVVLRQHRIGGRSRINYLLRYLHENPP